jgi:glycosyltransferase involved in cell wall biosynthesis
VSKVADGLTLGLIVKNESKNLKRIQEAMHPLDVVDEVVITDTGSEDDTVGVAKSFGWTVTQYHWDDDFSRARNANLAVVKTRFFVWMDADDLIEGFEKLPEYCEKMRDEWAWLNCGYIYQTDKNGNPIVIIDRERVVDLRWTGARWRWENRVHEVLAPNANVPFLNCDDIVWRHYPGLSLKDTAQRNLHLLQLQLMEQPENHRTYFYMGCQHYAMGQWQKAASWFMKYLDSGVWPQEMWRSAEFRADCLRQMAKEREARGQKDEARQLVEMSLDMDFCAIELEPTWADPYFGMAEGYVQIREWKKALFWHEQGLEMESCDPVIFMNPRDYDYNAYLVSHIARSELGDVEGALKDVEAGLKWFPDSKPLLEAKETYERGIKQKEMAKGAILLADNVGDKDILAFDKQMPQDVRLFRSYRQEVLGRATLLKDKGTQPRLDIFCGNVGVGEAWGPPSIDAGGIGGSETAVIHVARLLAQVGIQVRVLGNPGRYAGIHDGVEYWDWNLVPQDSRRDILVLWRQPGAATLPWKAQKIIAWLHDLNYRQALFNPEVAEKIDLVCGVSEWHSQYLAQTYPLIKDKMGVLRNGIDLGRYTGKRVTRDKNAIIWSSSPDRGLPILISMLPYFKELSKDIAIHVYYGTQNLEAVARMGELGASSFLGSLNEVIKKNEKHVIMHGRVGQRELALAQRKATWLIYPTTFTEVSWITGLEGQAAGMNIIASDVAAIPETLHGGGVTIPMSATNAPAQQRFIGMMSYWWEHPEEFDYAATQQGNVDRQTWERVVQEDWLPKIKEVLA